MFPTPSEVVMKHTMISQFVQICGNSVYMLHGCKMMLLFYTNSMLYDTHARQNPVLFSRNQMTVNATQACS